jgi:hypothetical protein
LPPGPNQDNMARQRHDDCPYPRASLCRTPYVWPPRLGWPLAGFLRLSRSPRAIHSCGRSR